MPTMIDVARLAGVSVSTVSHVVNGTRHVEPATLERVRAAIDQTSYRPDRLARSLKRAQSDTVGVIVSDPSEPAFAEMVHGIEEEATKAGLTLLLASSGEDPGREERAVQALLDRRVDGLILARAAGSTDRIMQLIAQDKRPLVLMDRLHEADVDQVGVENAAAMRDLVSTLRAQGHQRIGLVAGDLAVPTLLERHSGFEGDPALMVVGARDVASAREQAAVLLERVDRPTAIVAASTVLTAGLLYAARDLRLTIPTDLVVASFDGFAWSDLFLPPIITVRQPAMRVGAEAMRLLGHRIADPDGPRRTVRLEPVLELLSGDGAE
ncbi:MAG: LacI family transcriptional regulator [Actinobacteria bacterium]|nr:LacI family transcriptional regulator [Actinomycetota bacterium]